MLRCAQHLAADHDRPCAEFPLSAAHGLRVTGCDSSHGQGFFFTIEPCLRARNLPGTIACPERDLYRYQAAHPPRRYTTHGHRRTLELRCQSDALTTAWARVVSWKSSSSLAEPAQVASFEHTDQCRWL